MFPHGYFPAGYFAPNYWPPVLDTGSTPDVLDHDVFAPPPFSPDYETAGKQHRRKRKELRDEIRAMYLGIVATEPAEVVQAAAELVTGRSQETPPDPERMDWTKIAETIDQIDLNQLKLLSARVIAARRQQVDDDLAVITLLLL